jgi:hypothetical protein
MAAVPRSTSDTLAVSAGGGGAHCCSRRACLDGRRPAAAVSGSADTCWVPHQVPGSRRTATVRTLGHWTRLVDTGSRKRPALPPPATAAAPGGPCGNATLDRRQHSRPPPRDVRPGAGPQGAAAASTRHGLTASSVAWCSASIWSAPDGPGLLTLDASSIQTAPDRSHRIVWMIKRMIKPCGTAPSGCAEPARGTVPYAGECYLAGRNATWSSKATPATGWNE